MASSFEKSVKGGTKIKLAPPKSKYVEHILVATHAGEAGVAEIFRALQNRLRDSTWTVVFKALIIVHLMIREGEPDVTLKYLSDGASRKLAISNFTEGNLMDAVLTKHGRPVQTQGRNIRDYSNYLRIRAKTFGSTKIDYVRSGEGRLKRLSVDKGLLRETEAIQDQIEALCRCELLSHEPENEITLTAFRLLTMDLLVLFHVMNEGTINVLEHYFEMSHPDAERSLNIYRTFCKQTDKVVQYLSVARLHEHSTRLEIPKIKHAPTRLVEDLEAYLNDKDFEINRRQYLLQREAKRNAKGANGASKNTESNFSEMVSKPTKSFPSPKASADTPASQPSKGPAPDLIDFFESIEQNQQTMAQPQGPTPQGFQYTQQTGLMQQPVFNQNTGFQPQQVPFPTGPGNPFGQPQMAQPPVQTQAIQSNFTGAGFGGYGPQPPQTYIGPQLTSIPQNGVATFTSPTQQQQQQQFSPTGSDQLQPQPTNPFRQSVIGAMPGGPTSSFNASPMASPLHRSPTNPFARPGGQVSNSSQQSPLQPTPTGTNPFSHLQQQQQQQQSPSTLSPNSVSTNVTGSTNPFRQSMFVNQQSGQGWQNSQGTMGGLEQVETIPVFPRPGQQPQQ